MAKRWYVVHAYSGFEKTSRGAQGTDRAVEARGVLRSGVGATEEVVENARRAESAAASASFFPGYVLVEMELNDETWHLRQRNSPRDGFIGGKATGRRR